MERQATRRRMRGPERRAQLLAVARKVFGQNSFHTVTMDDVAREAGVTKPILYDHFPSKRDLYLALIEADVADLHQRVRAALAASTGNRERIRASFRAYFDFVDDHAEGFQLLLQEAIGAERQFRDVITEVREAIVTEVADLIVRESRGNLDRRRAEVVALGLVGMAETVARHEPTATPDERAEALDTLVRLAWTGITGL